MARLDKLGLLDKSYGKELAWGAVGKGRGAEALSFREMQSELPDIDLVLKDPENQPIPDNPSARFLISMALATRLSGQTFGQAIKYLLRLPQLFRAYSIRDALKAEAAVQKAGKLAKGYQPICYDRGFIAWSITQDGKEIMSASKYN